MISTLSNNSSLQISDQLVDIFKEKQQEIQSLAEKAPEDIVESVHLIRKRLKFLRAFVKLTQSCSENNDYKVINIMLRDSGRLISDCRDAHVRTILLEEFQNEPLHISQLDELLDHNRHQTKKIENDLLNGKSVFKKLIVEVNNDTLTNYFYSSDCNAEALLTGYSICYKKSYNAFHSELSSHEAHLLHEWRKRTKDLQYQMEILGDTLPNDLPPSLLEVSEMNDKLGRINDLFMLLEWLDGAKKSDPFLNLHKEINNQIKTLEKQADKAGHALYKYSPDEYQIELSAGIKL